MENNISEDNSVINKYSLFGIEIPAENRSSIRYPIRDMLQDELARVFTENYGLNWHQGYEGTAHSILRSMGEGQN